MDRRKTTFQRILAWADILVGAGFGLLYAVGLLYQISLLSAGGSLPTTETSSSAYVFAFVFASFITFSGLYTIEKYGKGLSKFYKYNSWFLIIYGAFNIVCVIAALISFKQTSPNVVYTLGSWVVTLASSISMALNGNYLRK